MAIAAIELSEHLRELAQQTGKTQDELLHEAVARFLRQAQPDNQLALLRQGRGLWKDRADLPDIGSLRNELDRFAS